MDRVRRTQGDFDCGVLGYDGMVALDNEVRAGTSSSSFLSLLDFWGPSLQAVRFQWREVDWRRAALAFAENAYDAARLVACVWRTGDAEATATTIAEMRRALRVQSFATYGDAFHIEANEAILNGFDALLSLDSGEIGVDHPRLSALHLHVIPSLYDVMWDAHIGGESSRACALGILYIRAVIALGHGPEPALWIIAHILAPLGAYDDVLAILATLPMDSATPSHRWRYHALRAASAQERGDAALLAESLEQLETMFDALSVDGMLGDGAWVDAYVLAVALLEAATQGVAAREIVRLAPFLHDKRARVLASRLKLEALAHAAPHDALRLASEVAATPPEALTERGHKAIDVLAGAGDWSAAAEIFRAGVASMWEAAEKVGGAWRRTAREGGAGLPDEGWVWAGRGIGDDVLRLQMLVAMKGREGRYTYDLDPRLAPLATRALPAMRFASTPRAVGPGAVGRAAFWRAREGVPRAFDAFRVTRDRLDWLQGGGTVLQVEDIHIAYLQQRGEIAPHAEPILKAGDASVARAVRWLGARSGARLTLCLAWRSGLLDRERRKFFMELEELEPLWTLPYVRWIVVQHDLTGAERALIARTPSLILPDDLDARDDIDGLTALFSLCDGVVAPKLSTRDMAAAAGARVLSVSIGHAAIEGARIAADGFSDRVFPNIRHVRESDRQDRQGVICEAAEIVRGWVPLTPAA